MKMLLAAGAAALTMAAAATPALADVQDFVVRNNSGAAVFYIQVSPNYSKSWEEDVLGDDVLPAYQSINIHMSGYADHCLFDIRIEDENGYYREYYDVDLCSVTYVDFP